jgi:hypothetical protein
LAQYGNDVAIGTVSQWQVSYREFLLHLREQAIPRDAETMRLMALIAASFPSRVIPAQHGVGGLAYKASISGKLSV